MRQHLKTEIRPDRRGGQFADGHERRERLPAELPADQFLPGGNLGEDRNGGRRWSNRILADYTAHLA